MSAKSTLYGIIHWALVEIRYEATEIKSNKIFAISNAFHNLSLRLLEAKTEEDYEALLAEIEKSVEANEGLSGIVNHVKNKPKLK